MCDHFFEMLVLVFRIGAVCSRFTVVVAHCKNLFIILPLRSHTMCIETRFCCWASDLFSFTDRILPYCLSHSRNTHGNLNVVCVVFFLSLCFLLLFLFAVDDDLCIERSLLWSNGPVRGISRNVLLASVTSIPKIPSTNFFLIIKKVNISSWWSLITIKSHRLISVNEFVSFLIFAIAINGIFIHAHDNTPTHRTRSMKNGYWNVTIKFFEFSAKFIHLMNTTNFKFICFEIFFLKII